MSEKRHYFQYYTEILGKELKEKGYEFYEFPDINKIIFEKYATISEYHAKKVVEKLRNDNCYARIICGYKKNKQKIKMYSVIFKKK